MKSFFIIYVTSGLLIDINSQLFKNLTCGVDNSRVTKLYEGKADIKTYPWMGTLFYPIGLKKITTAVVLVTRQIVLADANDIDMLPKHDMRARSRVALGQDCDKPHSIKVRDYAFHPDFRKDTYSALAIVQLEVDISFQDLRPICGPPTYFINPQFYAMTLSNNCKKGEVHIRRMRYVPNDRCTQFYNRTGLNDKKFWPNHATCARALTGGRCMWRSGTILVVKQDGHWRLLGFGLHGPGCQSPARFMDYGKQEQWVRRSVARIGQPAITRIGSRYLVMRRPLSSLQRYGPCDPEETKYEMYSDLVILQTNLPEGRVSYNVSLFQGVEYSCIIFKLQSEDMSAEEGQPCGLPENPRLHLRRWCAGPQHLCHGWQFIDIHFFLEITFQFTTRLKLAAYGQTAKIIDPLKAMIYANTYKKQPEVMDNYEVMKFLRVKAKQKKYLMLKWFLIPFSGYEADWTQDKDGYFRFYSNFYTKLVLLQDTDHPVMVVGFEDLPTNPFLVKKNRTRRTTTTRTTIRTRTTTKSKKKKSKKTRSPRKGGHKRSTTRKPKRTTTVNASTTSAATTTTVDVIDTTTIDLNW